ncbi:MAG: LTA synthase family protein [Ignavibacteriaceae bacterium]|nr:LTA synthase family protein [Ignavibacteriaceae bacterium]
MEFEELLVFTKRKLKEGIVKFTPPALGILLFFILIRAYEIIFVWRQTFSKDITTWVIISGALNDVVFFFQLSALLCALFLILYFINIKSAKIVFRSLAAFFIFGYMLLVLYFSKSAIPLGSDLYGYTIAEITHTFGAAGGFNILYLAALLLFIGVIVGAFILLDKIKLHRVLINLFYTLLVISLFGADYIAHSTTSFSNSAANTLSVNKLEYFLSKSYKYLFVGDFEIPMSNYYYDSDSSDSLSFKYINKDYPFLHEENAPDVLGNFFNIGDKKPNIVFLVTESLGKGYSGDGAYLGSFTPFLDSLAKCSLYWDNFLSCGGRTFAFPSSIFGSLPFAEKGFLELGESMPPHFSLLKFLESQGYTSRFIYGGDSHFDFMDTFFRRQNVNQLVDEKNFGAGYTKMPAGSSGFTWGYGDKELFEKYFEMLKNDNSKSRIDVSMTLSMHSPFVVANMDYYRNKFDNLIGKMNLTSDILAQDKSYKDMLACVLYTDEAYQYFFNEYKKRADYNNTIFIITGDHRMPEIPIVNQIDRFHVPLIIYSPMLKRTAKFSSVSSHFDIMPSILAFLKNNYKMQIPAQSTFMGSGLDTTRMFRNVHSYPLMRNKNELLDYLFHDYMLSDKTLYRIDSNLNLIQDNNQMMMDKINGLFDEFKERNNNMIKTKKLVPQAFIY